LPVESWANRSAHLVRRLTEEIEEAIMAAIAFDTLKFARRLKDVGVTEAQAEA
jgi:hypothetical protein